MTPKTLSIQDISTRLAEHAANMPDGSPVREDLELACKAITEFLHKYNLAISLLGDMNEMVPGTSGDVVGQAKSTYEAAVDSKRYRWLCRNITRLVLETAPHYLEDGGTSVTVKAITVRPDLGHNADPEFFDKLVGLMMGLHGE